MKSSPSIRARAKEALQSTIAYCKNTLVPACRKAYESFLGLLKKGLVTLSCWFHTSCRPACQSASKASAKWARATGQKAASYSKTTLIPTCKSGALSTGKALSRLLSVLKGIDYRQVCIHLFTGIKKITPYAIIWTIVFAVHYFINRDSQEQQTSTAPGYTYTHTRPTYTPQPEPEPDIGWFDDLAAKAALLPIVRDELASKIGAELGFSISIVPCRDDDSYWWIFVGNSNAEFSIQARIHDDLLCVVIAWCYDAWDNDRPIPGERIWGILKRHMK